MNRITSVFVAFIVALGLMASSLQAGEIIITDVEGGYLSWNNIDPTLFYTVQFRPNLDGAGGWDGSYRGLQDIQSADAIITVPVSMFWRVVGTANPQHTRTLSAESTILNAGYYEATDLTTVAPSLTAENIRAGVTVFGVEGTYDHRRIIRLEGDLAFGDVGVGHSPDRDMAIHNDGSAELEVASIDYPEGFSGAWSGVVEPAGIQTITVTFSPTEEKSYGGSLTVNSPAFSGTNTRQISGTGTEPDGMVLIPSGTNSGTNPLADDESHSEDYYPATYSLTVDSFYMDATHVTKALWDEVYEWATHPDRGAHVYDFDNAGQGKAANHPVHTVNWYDVVKWCNARSEKEGRPAVYTVDGAVYRTGRHDNVVQTSVAGYRLPTDVEWEYAARGGLSGRRFPWGDTIQHARANYQSLSSYSYDTSPSRGYHPTYNDGEDLYTSPVGSFAANGYGLYDMAGNVWEWIFDWHPSSVGSSRVSRGGSWSDYAYYCRIAARYGYRPGFAFNLFGFRAVLPPGQ